MRNYFSPQKFNCLQREQEELHFDLFLISIGAVRDCLRSPSINSQFIWRDYFFFLEAEALLKTVEHLG